jgi:hypothetical protein
MPRGYNPFQCSAEGHGLVRRIPLDEADQEWLESMNCAGWPALQLDHFERRFWDSGQTVREVCLLYVPSPPEPLIITLAA